MLRPEQDNEGLEFRARETPPCRSERRLSDAEPMSVSGAKRLNMAFQPPRAKVELGQRDADMAWIFAAVVFLTAVYLLVQFPAVRRATLWSIAVIVVLGIGYAYRQQQREAASKTAITEADLDLANLALFREYGMWRVTGTVRNRSRHVLSSITAVTTLEECKAGKCEVIDQADLSIYDTVPPGQARHFEHYVSFSAPPPADYKWSYRITEIRAE